MKERESLQFKVYSDKDLICISQGDPTRDEEGVVYIHPAQVDLLIKWVNEVKTDLEKD